MGLCGNFEFKVVFRTRNAIPEIGGGCKGKLVSAPAGDGIECAGFKLTVMEDLHFKKFCI